ncbi:ATP-binding cassette domain-containing protein [Hymenobacter weizhouensis]|uniref:ATP-binding cassette domain-containing protein n=1 Tax=Hymenobacter sp. YIM 151500-1 TaxID=2987689 RepID=UPI00222782DF|nr:ATP-binding cassette domain-containing protein [Hymenobacter sp. YIM 151500-1]UYZ63500.1 ATP-binding cassette domain-containing protein [Hymenobacter sp. YIM 151500-1]
MSTADTSPWVLEADGIQLSFGARPLLTDIYLRVQTGQIVALLGRNGCGKSTLLQTIFGARTVPDASVRVNGRRVVPAYPVPGLMSYLPQVPLLPGHLPAITAAGLLGVDVEEALADFPELREQVRSGQRLNELSGGTLRLLQVLLLVARSSRFLLLDEPFSGIMPLHVERLADLLRAAKRRTGLLITDHRYAEVLALADVVYLLRNGRLELLRNPESDLRDRGYLAS